MCELGNVYVVVVVLTQHVTKEHTDLVPMSCKQCQSCASTDQYGQAFPWDIKAALYFATSR